MASLNGHGMKTSIEVTGSNTTNEEELSTMEPIKRFAYLVG